MNSKLLVFLTILMLAPVCASSATIWDESVDGDLGNSIALRTNLGPLGAGASDILGDLDDAGNFAGPDPNDTIEFTTLDSWTFDVVVLTLGTATGIHYFLLDGANQVIDTPFINSPTADLFGTLPAGTYRLQAVPLSNIGTLSYTHRINVVASVLEPAIDIKPGSDPNCFNVTGHGVIPVAILGSSTFDVTLVDTSTLLFGGLEVRVRGNKGPLCSFEDSNGDTILDLVCQFEDDSTNWAPGDGDATLTGTLLDGTEFEGTDTICVVR